MPPATDRDSLGSGRSSLLANGCRCAAQALHTEDHALLEQCLELKEAKAIKATVQRLPVQVQPCSALRLLVR